MSHAVKATFRPYPGLRGLLRFPEKGRTRVVVVQGHRGCGKSTFIEHIPKLAGELGIPVVSPGTRLLPEEVNSGAFVAIDDIMTAVGGTAFASAMAVLEKVDRPVVWMLSTDGTTPDNLRALLDRADETEYVVLQPWDHKAMLEQATGLLGAAPGDGLMDLLRGTGGNPMLVDAMVRGLVEEGRTTVAAGERLALPQRVRDVVRTWLASMSDLARQVVQVCSVLSRTFTATQVSSMVAIPTGGLLPAFDEVIRAGILSGDTERLQFRQDVVRRVVVEDLPVWARFSLQEDAVGVHGRRRTPDPADSVERLMPAVLMAKTPLSAQLPLHTHDELFAMLVDVLVSAPVPVPEPRLVAERISSLVHHDSAQALARSRRVAYARGRPSDRPDVIVALTVLSNLEWSAGNLDEALRVGQRAADLSERLPVPEWRPYPLLTLASKLADLGNYDDAARLLTSAAEAVRTIGGAETAAAGAAGVVTARILMQRGKLAEAAQEIAETLRVAALPGNSWVMPFARAVLALISFRRGDIDTAAEAIWRSNAEGSAHPTVFRSLRLVWGEFLVTKEKLGYRRANELLTTRHHTLLEQRSMFLEEPGAPAVLVRSALADKDIALAYSIAAEMRGLADANPGYVTLRTAAAHVEGLLHDDSAGLRAASQGHVDLWARALATEDLGLALVRSGDDLGQAHLVLRTAVDQFERLGASTDAERVRGSLPQRVERPRGAATANPALTDTQRRIVLLAIEGLTNQQIGRRLSMTTHTVKYHLSHIFTKLGVSSRVELARHAGTAADG